MTGPTAYHAPDPLPRPQQGPAPAEPPSVLRGPWPPAPDGGKDAAAPGRRRGRARRIALTAAWAALAIGAGLLIGLGLHALVHGL